MARIDEILSSVIKGAEEAGAKIEQTTVGREEKIAGIGGAAGSMFGPVGAAAGAGLQDKTWGSAAGAGAGAMLGGAGGAALGGMAGRSLGQLIDADPDLSRLVGQLIGGIGGGAMGGHMGQNVFRPDGKTATYDSVEDAYLAGSKEAAERFKVAFLPLLGMAASALAPMAARAGLSRIAGGALGKIGGGLLGRAAGGLASAAAKPVGGALFDMGVGSAASKMVQPQQPQ